MDKKEFMDLSLEEKSKIYLNDFMERRTNNNYHGSDVIFDIHKYSIKEGYLEFVKFNKKLPRQYKLTEKGLEFIFED